jgi:hypothetical protein
MSGLPLRPVFPRVNTLAKYISMRESRNVQGARLILSLVAAMPRWEMSGNNLKVSGIIKGNTAEKYPQTLKLARFTVELQARPPHLLPRGAGGTPLAGSGRNGRMRGFAGQSKQLSPHPPLRGTFSRGEKV